MINKNLVAEVLVMLGFFIGLDTLIYKTKGSNIELVMVMIFLECFVFALLTLCIVVDRRDRKCQR